MRATIGGSALNDATFPRVFVLNTEVLLPGVHTCSGETRSSPLRGNAHRVNSAGSIIARDALPIRTKEFAKHGYLFGRYKAA